MRNPSSPSLYFIEFWFNPRGKNYWFNNAQAIINWLLISQFSKCNTDNDTFLVVIICMITRHHPGQDQDFWMSLVVSLVLLICSFIKFRDEGKVTENTNSQRCVTFVNFFLTWLSGDVWTGSEFWGGRWRSWRQMLRAAAQPLLLFAQRNHFVAKLLVRWPAYKPAVHIFGFDVGLYLMSVRK